RALWAVGADPAQGQPEIAGTLARLPFLVVQDRFLTETARLADVVLPAADLTEIEGSLINLTGRWQALHPALRPPGQARPHWQILTEAAQRLVEAKRRRAWAFASAADILAEIARLQPGWRGLNAKRLGDEGWQPPGREAVGQV
ncbi:MAG TPA: formate dehydrogenase subunit alpha, partial [Anaerolineae bacterium]|nr:formate dehydrogenase subunit alpha [Anaerolineae bacterium]